MRWICVPKRESRRDSTVRVLFSISAVSATPVARMRSGGATIAAGATRPLRNRVVFTGR
jgi:hypothetical protein